PWLRTMRHKTIAQKHHSDDTVPYSRKQLSFVEAAAESGDLRPLTYLADAELRGARPSRLLDRLLVSVDDALKTSGYGQDFDYARPLPLRRRSWALRLRAGEKLDIELLRKDLRFWKSIRMYNELRELHLLIVEILQMRSDDNIRDALETVLAVQKTGAA
ncbi:MAG TPA: hypothetical protein VFL31_02215, partial [Nitrospiraceae bacterium]|nr:hypothetical protein [Nitrospiraceae bacterium]